MPYKLFVIYLVTPSPYKSLGYNTKPSDGESLVLELRKMWSTPSLPELPGPL